MAHELNNPLQAVQNALELIRESIPSTDNTPEMVRLFDIGRQEIKRASRLASSLLDVHTPIANRQALVDWVDVIDDVMTLIKPAAEKYVIDLDVPTEHGVYVVPGIYADMHQIIRNLTQNALEAMRNNHTEARNNNNNQWRQSNGTLRIEIAPEGAWLRIAVIDSGHGLSEQDLAKLSELFYTTRSDGHGIGLYVCNLIAKANSARLSWYNNLDRGTTFQLVWPYNMKV
jgi:signal transduction histidine kinase